MEIENVSFFPKIVPKHKWWFKQVSPTYRKKLCKSGQRNTCWNNSLSTGKGHRKSRKKHASSATLLRLSHAQALAVRRNIDHYNLDMLIAIFMATVLVKRNRYLLLLPVKWNKYITILPVKWNKTMPQFLRNYCFYVDVTHRNPLRLLHISILRDVRCKYAIYLTTGETN